MALVFGGRVAGGFVACVRRAVAVVELEWSIR